MLCHRRVRVLRGTEGCSLLSRFLGRACRGPVRPRQGGSPEIQAEHPKLHAAVGELLVAFHRACGSPVRLSEVRDPEMLKAISMVGTDERQEDS